MARYDPDRKVWIIDRYEVATLDEVKQLYRTGAVSPYISFSCLGRLALKEEAAGKIRVFAMVDAYTQWALYPLHREIMSTLST